MGFFFLTTVLEVLCSLNLKSSDRNGNTEPEYYIRINGKQYTSLVTRWESVCSETNEIANYAFTQKPEKKTVGRSIMLYI